MDSLDFSSVMYGLILPYGVALPLRNIQYEFCRAKKNTIFNKTINIISQQKRTHNIKFAYCNYCLLEEKMNEWNNSH